MARIFQIISVIAFSAAGAGIFLAVFFWFKFDIWKIIGDLSGRTAKKSIEQMRRANAGSGKNFYGMLPETVNPRKMTEAVNRGEEMKTDKDVTGILQDWGCKTEGLGEGTEVLGQKKELTETQAESFRILQSIVLVHTNEVIP